MTGHAWVQRLLWQSATAFLFSLTGEMGGTITALRTQKRNPDRVNVYLDGRFAFGLQAIVAAKLRVGQRLSDAEIEALQEQDVLEKAYERALRFLSYRPRSTAEVRRNLRDKGIPSPVIEAVVERLTRAGLLDDAAFARYWVEQREEFRPRGGAALRHELLQKGVDREIIEEALQNLDEAHNAYHAAKKRASRYRHLDQATFYRRMAGYLQRRGFPYEVVKEITERVWRESHADAEDVSDESFG